MAITINGSGTITGATTLASTIVSPTMTGAVVSAMGSSVITSGTAQTSTSGTSIDFIGIPSWVKRITVMLSAVSTNGTSLPQIQLGTSGGVETTGYVGTLSSYPGSANSNSTTGILANCAGNASYNISGIITITSLGSNLWVASIVVTTDPAAGNYSSVGAARKTLSGTLDRVRITTVNGTDTFDAGSINILYE